MLQQTRVTPPADGLFEQFRSRIDDALAGGTLADGIIGKGLVFDGPEGPVKMVYADYAASGRALDQVERFVMEHVLPVYANPHTQASWCGRMINVLRRAAREEVAEYCGATDDDAVIFTGSGATAGLQKLVRLLGADRRDDAGRSALVLHGPYEHHSNLLPWRESGAEVIEIAEADEGGPDLAELEARLAQADGRRVIGTFSAGSNITGALSDVVAVSRLVKRYGGAVVWDYAGAAPYLPMVMHPAADVDLDAIVCSPHKFIGGPGASGVMVVRRSAVTIDRPSMAGGGTVRFVSPQACDYSPDVVAREEAGTPNVVGDIRAALALIVRDRIARAGLDEKARKMRSKALRIWRANPRIEILGRENEYALPIVSFRVQGEGGQLVHHQLITRILSDLFGVQARGGCACAGPYVHRLLGIDETESESVRQAILHGNELEKPGFVRVNFSPLMDDGEFVQLVGAVDMAARDCELLGEHFVADPETAIFEPKAA